MFDSSVLLPVLLVKGRVAVAGQVLHVRDLQIARYAAYVYIIRCLQSIREYSIVYAIIISNSLFVRCAGFSLGGSQM